MHFKRKEERTMNFNEPEIVKLGEARELIQTTLIPLDEEGPEAARTKLAVAVYVTEE